MQTGIKIKAPAPESRRFSGIEAADAIRSHGSVYNRSVNSPKKNPSHRLRELPSVNRLLAQPALRDLAEVLPAPLLTDAARAALSAARMELRRDGADAALQPDAKSLAERAAADALRRAAPSLQAAINATGIVLHTGLGRARLAPAACDALRRIAENHSNLEIDRETGQRGARRDHIAELLRERTGAQDAAVVNNCAGAVFLSIAALAQGREVVISRGELVEIGGGFRIPDILRASGAMLVEVGTTNRTRIRDYADAVTERTGLILRCRPSNFAVVGFTEAAETAALAALGRERGIPFMDDQGSGAILDGAEFGLGGKGTLRDSVQAGANLITASGDKLLGGPQAGLILGDAALISQIVAHPLARALRVDKFTLAALEATLRLYRDPDAAKREIPTLRYLNRNEAELRRMARLLANRIRAALPPGCAEIALVAARSQVGGGSLPGESLPTVCVRVRAAGGVPTAAEFAARLRRDPAAVFARIKDDGILFDPRTLETAEFAPIAAAIKAALISEFGC